LSAGSAPHTTAATDGWEGDELATLDVSGPAGVLTGAAERAAQQHGETSQHPSDGHPDTSTAAGVLRIRFQNTMLTLHRSQTGQHRLSGYDLRTCTGAMPGVSWQGPAYTTGPRISSRTTPFNMTDEIRAVFAPHLPE